jgi:hypothetical protein
VIRRVAISVIVEAAEAKTPSKATIPEVVAAAEIMVREGAAVEPAAQEAIRSAHTASEASAEMTTAKPASMTTAEPASAMSPASATASRKSGARCDCYS